MNYDELEGKILEAIDAKTPDMGSLTFAQKDDIVPSKTLLGLGIRCWIIWIGKWCC